MNLIPLVSTSSMQWNLEYNSVHSFIRVYNKHATNQSMKNIFDLLVVYIYYTTKSYYIYNKN